MNQLTEAAASIGLAIVGVAIIALLVSRKSQTPAVIQSLGSAFSNALGIATSPVTGANVQLNTSYPSSGGMSLQGLNMPGLGYGY